ncbi:hypothetical protein [Enterococcus phage vB_EfaP_Ef6.2]|uniref:Uncharacterized protein n=1 Tax=Enterococcus phage vB_EfaP_Ef6.2 TaxID=2546621 RepID=A0A4D6DS41_9CAUD|nr:hypothetical protein H3T65_gp03 [Enterococcus phage vB_EfaP_Ef6.2]QBZ69175.1 hypothetical protein [Enterococcus phage vB_EfaP_Ef6.2]
MQDIKVGDLVEVIENTSGAYKNKSERFKKGDKAIVTKVMSSIVRICDKKVGDKQYGNLIAKSEIKKVETKPELTENEEELVLLLSEKIKEKDNLIKEIKEISKKLLTK